jgi:hypothetical protein
VLTHTTRSHSATGWESQGEVSLHVANGDEFPTAVHKLNDWLQEQARMEHGAAPAAGGAPPPLFMLAHNGHRCDWPVLTASMAARGMALPDCVTLLGCSRYLFVDGIGDILGRKWSMTNVYAARFDGARIPEQHTARGDVRCGVRLLRACVAC